MLSYYRNPKTEDLIIWDSEENEVFIIEKIRKVRAFVEKDLFSPTGDDGKPTIHRKIRGGKKGKRKDKLTPEKISEIRRLKSEMKSTREISEELGISVAAVYKYLK